MTPLPAFDVSHRYSSRGRKIVTEGEVTRVMLSTALGKDKVALVVLVTCLFTTSLGVGLIVPLLPVYAESLGASGLWIGLIFGANPFIRATLMLVFGSLSDRRGRKRFITLGLMGYFCVSLSFVLASRAIHLLLLRLLQGAFSAMVTPVARAYAGDLSPPGREGAVMGLVNFGFFAGFGAGPVLGGILADQLGMNAPFYGMAILSILSAATVHMLVPERPPRSTGQGEETRSLNGPTMLRNDVVRGLIAVRGLVALGRGIFSTLLPLLGRLTLGLTGTEVGLVVTTRALLSSLLQPACGALADRHNRKWLVTGGIVLAPLALYAVPFARELGQLMAAAAMLGISAGVSVPAATAIAVDQGRQYGMGSVMGLIGMCQSFGMAGGAVIGGALRDLVGVGGAFQAASILSVMGIVLFLWHTRHYHFDPRGSSARNLARKLQ